jgi:hypothetical protein
VSEAPILFLDELQRAPRRRRMQLFRRKGCFAIATHQDHTPELAAAGLAVYTTRLEGLEAEEVIRLIARRIEWARRGPGPVPVVGPAAVQTLIRRHGSDLRAIECDLYHVFQQMKSTSNVEL